MLKAYIPPECSQFNRLSALPNIFTVDCVKRLQATVSLSAVVWLQCFEPKSVNKSSKNCHNKCFATVLAKVSVCRFDTANAAATVLIQKLTCTFEYLKKESTGVLMLSKFHHICCESF